MSATLRLFTVLGVLLCTLGLVCADELRIEALDGGVVDLSGLTQIIAQQKSINIVADGADSTVDLSGLTSFSARPDAPASIVSAANNGAITLNGTKTTLNGPVQLELTATGTVTLGALELGANALLTGSGTLGGGLINGGEVSPGGTDAAGSINITGPYTQTDQGKLKIELGGITPGSQYDRLTSTAAASLNGALNVSLINNYRPEAGRRFDVLTASSRSGQFSSTSGLDLGGGAKLNLDYAATGAALIASGTGLPDGEGPEISDVRFEGLTLTDGFSITQSGTITLTADDPSGIDRVEFLLDGNRFATDPRGINPASALLSIAGIADGSYELTIIAFDTLNNATSLTYSVLIGTSVSDVPDLVVTALQIPAEHLPGQSANVTWTVRNRGNMTAHGPWTDKLYISPDNTFGNGNDTLLTSASFPAGSSLAPGAAYERAFSITLPNTPGNYWLIVVTDADNQVAEEGGESNNVLISETPLVVQSELPDLVVTEVIPPADGVLSGSTTEITFVVKNAGVRATEVNWKDLVILSPDTALIDPPPFLFNEDVRGQFDNPQFLLPGESYQQTIPITLPEDKIGAFYIAVYADARSRGPKGGVFQVPEQNESNNITFSDSFTIALAPQPDLVVADIDASPKPVFSGQELTVTWTARNQGQGPTDSGTWTDAVYLSANNQPTIDTAQDIWIGTQPRQGAILQPGQSDTGLLLKKRLPANLQGNFYVKVAADLNNEITELGAEDNNIGVSAQPIQVVLSVPVDLAATDIHGPQTGVPGHAIEVTWSAENVGAEPESSLAWQDAIYLSSDQVLDGSDVQLSTFAAVTSTTPGGQPTLPPYTHTRSVRLPNNTAAGTYYLIVKIDAEDEVFELAEGEQNNVLASAVPIIIELMPTDLTVEVNFDAAHQLPTAITAGQSLPLSWRVTNTGQAATPVFSWTDRVYLSGDATLGDDDKLLATFIHGGGLAPGASYVVTQNVTMPLVGPGNYFLLVKTDYTNLVYEQPPGEDNNLVSSPLTVSGDAPDLTAADCAAPDSLSSGSPLHIEWTVSNGGTLPTSASSWVDTVYLSTDQSLDPRNTIELGARSSPPGGLAAGDSYTQAADFNVPLQLSGLFYLIQQTDRNNSVFEISENNNLCIRPILINLDPNKLSNLTVRAFSAPNTALAGQPMSVTWTVTNTGIGPTNVTYWNDGVYLSLDQFLDPGQDLFIGRAFIDQPLNGGASYTRTANFNVPAGIEEPYYVFMATDLNHQVVETDEGDNVGGPEAIQVILPPPSDLMVGEVTPPAHGILGQEAIFSWNITNAGNQPVSGGWRDSVYLSSDPQWDIDDKRVGTFARIPGPLNPGESITLTGTGTIPAVLPGTYYVIVRTDVFNQIPESNEANNLGSSAGAFEVSAIPLALGTPFEGSLVNSQEQYFQFDVAAGETARITLDHTSPTAWTELYVRYGAVPTPGQFDFLFDAPAQPDQEITIPTTQAGRYYVLAKATAGVLEPSVGFSLLAETIPFGITSVEPAVVGTGQVTLRLKGSRWDDGTVFRVRNVATGQEIEAGKNQVSSAAEARAEFDLSGATLGQYNVIAVSTAGTAVLPAVITVEPASSLIADYEMSQGPTIRRGTSGSRSFTVTNRSNIDIPFLTIFVATWRIEGLSVFIPSIGSQPPSEAEGLQSGELMFENVSPGEQVTLPMVIEVGRSYSYGEMPVFIDVAAYSYDQYRDGPLSVQAAEFLKYFLTNPELDPVIATYFRENFIDTVRTLFNTYRFDAPKVEEPQLLTGQTRSSEALLSPLSNATTSSASEDRWLCYTATRGLAADCALVCVVGCTAAGKSALCISPCVTFFCPAVASWGYNCCDHPCSPGCPRAPFCGPSTPPPPPPPCPEKCRKICVVYNFPDGGCAEWGTRCSKTYCHPNSAAQDPNLKSGLAGVGTERLVSKEDRFIYRIEFENLETATAPAAGIRISDAINPLLRLGSLRLGDIHFGNTTVDVPDGRTSFQTTVDLTASAGVLVEVTAGVNAETNEAFWILRSIDPATGEPPTDGTVGFLPPEDGTGRGQGWVEFSILPKSQAPVGSVILNQATITFDFEEPIVTNEWVNTLAEAPTELVITTDLPAAKVNQAYSGSINATGGTLPYTFTLIAGAGDLPPGLSLNADGTITGTPTQSGNYSFAVQIADAANHSSVQQASITVAALENELPVANAGQDQTVALGSGVTLNGGTSTDPDNGPQPLSYTWQFIAVPADSALHNANLINANTAQASFTPDVPGKYRLRLTVSDGAASSAPDEVIVTATFDIFSDPRLFAMQQYRDLLGREAEPGGAEYWDQVIANGTFTRAQVVELFFNSPEFSVRIAPIVRLYFAAFGRVADYGGVRYWSGLYRNGTPLEAIAEYFATSPEFLEKYGALSNSEFARRMYLNVLGREPEPGAKEWWAGQLDSGRMTRGQVLLGFSDSAEHQQRTANAVIVVMMYVGLLRRAPEPGAVEYWVGYLNAGNGLLALIQGFLDSAEYHNRFLPWGMSTPMAQEPAAPGTEPPTGPKRLPADSEPAETAPGTAAPLPASLVQWLAEQHASAEQISRDETGNLIVFTSEAVLLEPDDNEAADVFLYDIYRDELNLLSVTPTGHAGNGPSTRARLSGDGHWVVFVSAANDLVSDDANAAADIFLLDLTQQAIQRIGTEQAGQPSWADADHPAVDAVGATLAYQRPDAQGRSQIYLYDRHRGLTTQASRRLHTAAGAVLDNSRPALSADGRYLAYLEITTAEAGPVLSRMVRLVDLTTGDEAWMPWPAEVDPEADDWIAYFSPDNRLLVWQVSSSIITDRRDTAPQTPVIELVNPLTGPESE